MLVTPGNRFLTLFKRLPAARLDILNKKEIGLISKFLNALPAILNPSLTRLRVIIPRVPVSAKNIGMINFRFLSNVSLTSVKAFLFPVIKPPINLSA